MLREHDNTTKAVSWRCAQAGLWIATRDDGRPAGIVVERWSEGFQVTTSIGRDLGTFPALEEAQRALERADVTARARAAARR
ncbi:hypothetical protein [Herbiconiux daphne]|uniref:DUF2188 domain-containing protein n=1 Tax=Herbiconiux daphne TaxID=2970914 RepID=A0ABT2H7X8_9MICO|nr:hypothetical protein [Herbiconiux daphne]MCS5736055.1 hypothetical protein [Herbiconiux daphne]